jgi:perosamine synthetase
MIPVNTPLLDGEERTLLNTCIDTAWISAEGAYVEQFERDFAAFVGRTHGIAVNNGSSALELALAALDIGPGDEVILPTFTIISCASAVVRAGATPVFVDCEPDTWNMQVDALTELITPRTRAIMAVHIYGLPVDMGPLLALARTHDLAVIEDAAEAHGLHYDGKPCGSFGNLSTFSFYANKLVTTGEGGMVMSDDAELAARCRSLRNLAFGREHRFQHEALGWNFRMSNLQAALGVAQTAQLPRFLNIKRTMGDRYTRNLRDVPGLQLPVARTAHAENAYWVYGVVLDDTLPFDAAAMMRALAARGIGTRPFFWPMHEQPVLRQRGLVGSRRFPVAERLARRGFYLPGGAGLSLSAVDEVCDTLREILARGEVPA